MSVSTFESIVIDLFVKEEKIQLIFFKAHLK